MCTQKGKNARLDVSPSRFHNLEMRDNLESLYRDVYTPEVISTLEFLGKFNENQK